VAIVVAPSACAHQFCLARRVCSPQLRMSRTTLAQAVKKGNKEGAAALGAGSGIARRRVPSPLVHAAHSVKLPPQRKSRLSSKTHRLPLLHRPPVHRLLTLHPPSHQPRLQSQPEHRQEHPHQSQLPTPLTRLHQCRRSSCAPQNMPSVEGCSGRGPPAARLG